MTVKNDLLIEIGTEELPPKALKILSGAFTKGVIDGLSDAGFQPGEHKAFATPRRLAVLIKDVPEAQPDRDIEKKGPSLKAAYDADGNPTKAVEGFARSCGVSVDKLEQQETDKGVWLVFRANEKGKQLSALLAEIVNQSLAKLPIPKKMRWGDSDAEFVRPVHWIVMLHGKNVIESEILGVSSSRVTHGHRFHANEVLSLHEANDYEEQLRANGFVIADRGERIKIIKQQVEKLATELGGTAVIDIDLLDEVAALVEWPVAIAGGFDKKYLNVPQEALIKTMQDNQKYFSIVDKKGALKPYFITVSNIESKTPDKIKAGNERVIHPRFADAAFFWDQDQKQKIEAFLPRLNDVVFQSKLGSVGDKINRISKLAEVVANSIGADVAHVKRAAILCKCDLMTEMVGEFPTLQGVMGRYYALTSGEDAEVARAIEEQYWPRHAGDMTPETDIGQALSISDKLDTLVGIFAIGQKPTGEKDPYALRRASLGVLRIIIERKLDLDLLELLKTAVDGLPDKLNTKDVVPDVFEYMLERLRVYYLNKDFTPDVFDAVAVLKPAKPLDFDKRIKAVKVFRDLPEAKSLAAANKRVGNILKKSKIKENCVVDESLFEEKAEKTLYSKLNSLSGSVEPMFDKGDYEKALCKLSSLREPVDDFFVSVMVMAEDETVKNNLIALLSQMSALFLRTADLSRLHQETR
jgi:glycyl-tRNA synthetase beta chain